ncbi:hypothetical protein GWI33_016407 [Rhynchophorus ferrugineus]|uniref:Uncharacterized protein n=1 Tax=Rhynchophorus ferrugineus TaxID=354439 RepID=A0A834I3K3_RHYFE|nr:hypothetical protein GWI33_016407 [Rhynchophorus ferrugineus]
MKPSSLQAESRNIRDNLRPWAKNLNPPKPIFQKTSKDRLIIKKRERLKPFFAHIRNQSPILGRRKGETGEVDGCLDLCVYIRIVHPYKPATVSQTHRPLSITLNHTHVNAAATDQPEPIYIIYLDAVYRA